MLTTRIEIEMVLFRFYLILAYFKNNELKSRKTLI